MDNQRNLILAVVLSAVLLFGWDFAMRHYFPEPEKDVPANMASREDVPQERIAGDAVSDIAVTVDLDEAIAAPGRIPIEAAEVVGSINPVGARIDDIDLTTHRQAVEKDSGPVRLFAPAGTPGQQYAQFRWLGDGVSLPDAETRWQVIEGDKLTQKTPVTLGWNNGAGLSFRQKFTIDDHYMINVTQTVANTSGSTLALRPYAMIVRTDANASKDTFNVHSGPISAHDNAVDFGTNYKDVANAGSVTVEGRTNWVGFTDIYWMSALIPTDGESATSTFRSQTRGEYQEHRGVYRAELLYAPVNLPAGQQLSRTTRLFAGAKESAVLDMYQDQGVTKFGLAIDWGWFRFIAWPIWQVLIALFDLTKNFGVAIILLTLIVRGIMFPIAQKQFKSMAQMRVVQPKMKALQERYKDDKAKLQEEMAKLYKEEKVNPLAGCLPIFLQIPIFFALYKTLLLSIEMRHEPFIGWIKDLSAPDPLHFLNLFGLLDFTPPGFLAIGPLALLLGCTMYFQFKLNPSAMDPTQQQIFAFMPWIMMFVMAPFAAGLLIYWCTSNILTIAQQKYLYAKNPQMREMAEKEAAAKAAEREKAKG
ncbi:membrane protein insertase YidC [Aurantiacibacter xanthus]|uniref:Membrane protein insertase YidC n=1 Tax=Aurantiacibacter xanthus TaxID=1784712 RepID=A0A3A1PJ75_9SPHN|nr:membrane protein insertase YidC [Aurantiacibacter xanthus]RIV92843.1 membrane protein insertase YidC [Aurantiacibacter xanthus]